MSDIIEPGLVVLDADLGPEKSGVIRALADRVAASGRATDAEALFADAWKREEQAPTGLPGGLAIPHAKSPAVKQASLARRAVAEGVGTALLLAAVVGSGIMGEQLAAGNVAHRAPV